MDTRGLYAKFRVERTDGDPERKHVLCPYFVLDIAHDPHARMALETYAASCRVEHPALAADLLALLART